MISIEANIWRGKLLFRTEIRTADKKLQARPQGTDDDLGFSDWVFQIDDTSGAVIADWLMTLWSDFSKTHQKVSTGMEKVRNIYQRSIADVVAFEKN